MHGKEDNENGDKRQVRKGERVVRPEVGRMDKRNLLAKCPSVNAALMHSSLC